MSIMNKQLPAISPWQKITTLGGYALLAGLLQLSIAYAEEPTDPVRVANIGTGTHGVVIPDRIPEAKETVPDWVKDATFYQIFPERFCNGDPTNDPTRESLEFPNLVNKDWKLMPWRSSWYQRADWEKKQGPNFYDNGVFDRRYGGDLQGVVNKLDYIEDLGVNVIYFNPVFYARSLHKYDGNTYHHVDPYFGPDPEGDLEMMASETSDPKTWKMTAADELFFELVKAAHDRGIRVIIDGVFNHTGRGFFAFENLLKEQEASPYKDWYIVNSFDDPTTPAENEFRYKGWWGVMTLPEFADTANGKDLHPGPKEYIFDATRKWMDPNGDGDPSDGIDGWRLDVAAEVPAKFWRDWNAHVRMVNPEAYTVAEHWEDAAHFLHEGGFSATMNYHGFSWPVKGYLIDGTLSPSDAAEMLVKRLHNYPVERQYAMQNLIDSHDTDRVASMIVNAPKGRPYLQPERFDYDVNERASPRHWSDYDTSKPDAEDRRIQRLVTLMQVTYVGAPMVYYGTECGMWGADDPCDRMPMTWPNEGVSGTDQQAGADLAEFDSQLHQFYRAAYHLRHHCESLRRGDFEVLKTDNMTKGLAFARKSDKETTYTLFNRGDKQWEVELPLPNKNADAQQIFTASGEPGAEAFKSGRTVTMVIPPRDAAVFLIK